MKTNLTPRSFLVTPLAFLAAFYNLQASAVQVTNPASFTLPMQVIDYRNSPVGLLPGGTSITNQYASLGVIHDGSTTTPPGPPGMSSLSGLPGLESNAGDPDPNLPITILFTQPITQVGAFYLMGFSQDSITLTANRADNSVIESFTILPSKMPLRPGPFGFNEGFLGLIVNESIHSVTFAPSTAPFVIDDLHINQPIPEPSIGALVGGFALGLCAFARNSMRRQVA
jgi:hypothetical protein